jgi:hypothetical protein
MSQLDGPFLLTVGMCCQNMQSLQHHVIMPITWTCVAVDDAPIYW